MASISPGDSSSDRRMQVSVLKWVERFQSAAIRWLCDRSQRGATCGLKSLTRSPRVRAAAMQAIPATRNGTRSNLTRHAANRLGADGVRVLRGMARQRFANIDRPSSPAGGAQARGACGPARRLALSIANRRRRRGAAARAASTPARRQRLQAAHRRRHLRLSGRGGSSSREYPGSRWRGRVAGLDPASVSAVAPHFCRWRGGGSATGGGFRGQGALAARGGETRPIRAGVQSVVSALGGGADAGVAEPQPAVGQGLRGVYRDGPDMALSRKRPNPAAEADTPEKTMTYSKTDSEDLYCQRGEMENRIEERQLDLFADGASAHGMRANRPRLLVALMAYALLCALRRLDPSPTPASPPPRAEAYASNRSRSPHGFASASAASSAQWIRTIPSRTSSAPPEDDYPPPQLEAAHNSPFPATTGTSPNRTARRRPTGAPTRPENGSDRANPKITADITQRASNQRRMRNPG